MKVVLVVDDESVIALSTVMALEDAGFATVTAYDGREALDLIERSRPDVIVTDYMMPRMSGLDLALATKGEEGTMDIPVILVSAAPGDVEQSHPGLFAAIVRKPFLPEELARIVEDLAGPASGGQPTML